jgi:predicted porin
MRVILVKKTILATAMAAVLVAPAAYAGAAADGLYGKIRLGVQDADAKDELDVVSGKLVFGFKGESDLGNGMTASFGIEYEDDNADNEAAGTLSADKSWVALGGDFGKLIIGEHSDMAWWAASGVDILNYGTAEATSMGHNTSPPDAIQYRGSAGDISFGASMTTNGAEDMGYTLLGFGYAGDGFTFGAQFISADDAVSPGGVVAGESGSQIGGTYMVGDITLGLLVADNGADDDSGGTDFGLQIPLAGGNLGIVVSVLDADDSDSTDVIFNKSLGGGAFWGVELNTHDADDSDATTAYYGINF